MLIHDSTAHVVMSNIKFLRLIVDRIHLTMTSRCVCIVRLYYVCEVVHSFVLQSETLTFYSPVQCFWENSCAWLYSVGCGWSKEEEPLALRRTFHWFETKAFLKSHSRTKRCSFFFHLRCAIWLPRRFCLMTGISKFCVDSTIFTPCYYCSSIMYVGLNMTYASSFQMLRGN